MIPNRYKYNRNIDDILIDKMLNFFIKKKLFNSKTLNKHDQIDFHKKIKKIYIEKGKLKDSNICFIKKNI